MNSEQLKHLTDVYAEAMRRFSVVRDIAQRKRSTFVALVRAFNAAPKRKRKEMLPEMAMCWLVYRGAARCQAEYYAEVERALNNLELALLDMSQRLGERLPDEYRSLETRKLL